MLAFEVTVNGKRRYIAGHVDAQSVQLILWGTARFEPAASLNTFVAVPNNSPGSLATLSYEPERVVIGVSTPAENCTLVAIENCTLYG